MLENLIGATILSIKSKYDYALLVLETDKGTMTFYHA